MADEALGGGTRWVQGRHAHSTRAQDVGDDTSGDVLGPENGNVGAGADAVLYDTLGRDIDTICFLTHYCLFTDT